MFTVYESGGIQSPYVPGLFRQRHVTKISRSSVTGQAGREDHPQEGVSRTFQQAAGWPALQARVYEQVESLTQSSRANVFARDIMSSPVITLPLTASLSQAWEVVRSKRFRHIPFLGADDVLVGILSDRDLLRGAMESAWVKTSRSAATQADNSIQPLVSHPVLVAAPDAELRAIARVLLDERIGALPVLSEDGGLAGMITRSDILRVMVAHPDFDQWV